MSLERCLTLNLLERSRSLHISIEGCDSTPTHTRREEWSTMNVKTTSANVISRSTCSIPEVSLTLFVGLMRHAFTNEELVEKSSACALQRMLSLRNTIKRIRPRSLIGTVTCPVTCDSLRWSDILVKACPGMGRI